MIRLGTLFIYYTILSQILVYAAVRFTNVKCEEYDPPFATVPICRLNVLRRGVVAGNLQVKLHQLPVTNISVNLSLYKKASGYRPFLYNITVDFCKFMNNRKRQPFGMIFLSMLLKDSNINHSCPYNHDIIVKNLLLDDQNFQYLPLPNGEYMFQVLVAAYNDWKAKVRVFIDLRNLGKS